MRSARFLWPLLLAGCASWHAETMPPPGSVTGKLAGQLRVITTDGTAILADQVHFATDSATMTKLVVDEIQFDSLRRIPVMAGATLTVDTVYWNGQVEFFIHETRTTTIPRSGIVRVEKKVQPTDEQYEVIGSLGLMVISVAGYLVLHALHLD